MWAQLLTVVISWCLARGYVNALHQRHGRIPDSTSMSVTIAITATGWLLYKSAVYMSMALSPIMTSILLCLVCGVSVYQPALSILRYHTGMPYVFFPPLLPFEIAELLCLVLWALILRPLSALLESNILKHAYWFWSEFERFWNLQEDDALTRLDQERSRAADSSATDTQTPQSSAVEY